jgi:hypothetical protein
VRGRDVWLNSPRRLKLVDDDAAVDQLDRMTHSCSLDVSEGGESTLDEIAEHFSVSRQGIDLAVASAQKSYAAAAHNMGINFREDYDE